MRRLCILWLLAAAAMLPSCRRAAERAAERIRVEAVENVAPHGLSGFDMTLRIANETGYNLVLQRARIDLCYEDVRACSATLREEVGVPKRAVSSVVTRWRLRLSDPLVLYAALRRVQGGDLSQLTVNFAIEGRGGPVPVNISRDTVSLSEFLNIFGISVDDLQNFFSE